MRLLHPLVIAVSILFGVASSAQQSSYAPRKMPDDAPPSAIVLDIENTDTRPEGETVRLLQLPAASQEYQEERRCMTVCSTWGEDCVMSNSSSGRVTRKCVRMCKSFTVECL